MHLLLKHPEKQREIEYERDKGDKHYERLMYGEPEDERKRKDSDRERDRREHEELDKDLHKSNQRSYDRSSGARGRQWNIEQAGRLSDLHERYSSIQLKEHWKEVGERNPEMQEFAMKELAHIERLEAEGRMERFKDVDLDYLIDGKDEHQRLIDRIIEEDRRTFPEMLERLKNPDIDLSKLELERGDDMAELLGFEKEHEPEKEPELEHLVEPRKQEEKAKEAEEYEQRTGFAGAADQDRGMATIRSKSSHFSHDITPGASTYLAFQHFSRSACQAMTEIVL